MSSLTSELIYVIYIYTYTSPSLLPLPFALLKSKKLMYRQRVSSVHTLYKVAHTSVTNIQIIPFVGPKTIKTVDEVKTILLGICGWPVSMTNIQATSNRLQSDWSESHVVSMEKVETTTTTKPPQKTPNKQTKNPHQNTPPNPNQKNTIGF